VTARAAIGFVLVFVALAACGRDDLEAVRAGQGPRNAAVTTVAPTTTAAAPATTPAGGLATASARFLAPCVVEVQTSEPTRIGASVSGYRYPLESFDEMVDGVRVYDFRDVVARRRAELPPSELGIGVRAYAGRPGEVPDPPYTDKIRDLAVAHPTIDECVGGEPGDVTGRPGTG
jgi:hypothetical protein